MEKSRWQVRNLRWWNLPIPLYTKGGADGVWKRIGYVWNQKVYAVNNVTLGWIAFVEDQVPDKLDKHSCARCGLVQPDVDVAIDSKLLAEWLEKTAWIQEEYSQGKLKHLNVLGQHRAEVLRAEITYLRKVAESLAGDLAQSKKLPNLQQITRPKKLPNLQQITRPEKLLQDVAAILRMSSKPVTPLVFQKLSEVQQHLRNQTAGILGHNMELAAYHYPGSVQEMPILAFPEDLTKIQQANYEPLYRRKSVTIESSA